MPALPWYAWAVIAGILGAGGLAYLVSYFRGAQKATIENVGLKQQTQATIEGQAEEEISRQERDKELSKVGKPTIDEFDKL